jgi:fatty-acyl-CoA synthase
VTKEPERQIFADMQTPLSPVSFLDRAAAAFANRKAIVDGDFSLTYREFADRAYRLAGLLLDAGVRPGDRVAALCVNSHVMLELHNGVPLLGAVLVPMNIRLSVTEMAYVIEHSGARLIVATQELAEFARNLSAQTGVRLMLAGSPAMSTSNF